MGHRKTKSVASEVSTDLLGLRLSRFSDYPREAVLCAREDARREEGQNAMRGNLQTARRKVDLPSAPRLRLARLSLRQRA